MAKQRKFNKVSLSVGASSDTEVLVQAEEIVKNYDEAELYEKRVQEAKEKEDLKNFKNCRRCNMTANCPSALRAGVRQTMT